ncbi:MBL fold metallo-hydrolase [Skermanella sp. TT6]|uniref:MBL fold metallo-hydrolase n=1 Tax=Skermanella cutis TaxID=2775420 RepID=A0ABX7BCR2_9PROT|nr:MBL fold metallo-hydrolase [Skermanella sp. TT6]QQP91992.1 MBL fold metallo-hydrolase [Skermanella sp. TT6]
MRITILGSGGSGGVPLIGGDWGACDPANPKNRRSRPSILVEDRGGRVLVDSSPDLREQLIANRTTWLSGVIFTHGHADHTHGLDDLRGINHAMNAPLDVYADRGTLDDLMHRFGYCFTPIKPGGLYYKPALVAHEITGPFSVGGIEILPFEQDHGWMKTLGFRFGRFGYSTDVVRMEDAAFEALKGIDTWVVDCVRVAPAHPVHAHLELTLQWIDRLRPRRAYLTHMNQSMDYDTVLAMLPPGVEPAYDGLVIDIPD